MASHEGDVVQVVNGISNINVSSTRNSAHHYLHLDQELCKKIIGYILPQFKLKIGPSLLPGGGSGLFAVEDIEAGQEIYRSKPMVMTPVTTLNDHVCDYCYKDSSLLWVRSARMNLERKPEALVETETDFHLDVCSGCKKAYYCSKVCVLKSLFLLF